PPNPHGPPSGPKCGDGICNGAETCSSCPHDCHGCVCGDQICGRNENCGSCPADCGACPVCGDHKCNGGEDCASCSGDCGACQPREYVFRVDKVDIRNNRSNCMFCTSDTDYVVLAVTHPRTPTSTIDDYVTTTHAVYLGNLPKGVYPLTPQPGHPDFFYDTSSCADQSCPNTVGALNPLPCARWDLPENQQCNALMSPPYMKGQRGKETATVAFTMWNTNQPVFFSYLVVNAGYQNPSYAWMAQTWAKRGNLEPWMAHNNKPYVAPGTQSWASYCGLNGPLWDCTGLSVTSLLKLLDLDSGPSVGGQISFGLGVIKGISTFFGFGLTGHCDGPVALYQTSTNGRNLSGLAACAFYPQEIAHPGINSANGLNGCGDNSLYVVSSSYGPADTTGCPSF